MTNRPPAPCSIAPGLPLSRRPAPRRLMTLALAVLVIAAAVPAVSADENTVLWDYTCYEFTDTSDNGAYSGAGGDSAKFNQMFFNNIDLLGTLAYVVIDIDSTNIGYDGQGKLLPSGSHEFTYNLKYQPQKRGVVYIERFTTSTRLTIFLNDWYKADLTGFQVAQLYDFYLYQGESFTSWTTGTQFKNLGVGFTGDATNPYKAAVRYNTRSSWVSGIEWANHISINRLPEFPISGTETTLTRIIEGKIYNSKFTIYSGDEIIYNDNSGYDLPDIWYKGDTATKCVIISPTGKDYTFPMVSGGAVTTPASVTVYVQSSQTGALLADASLSILASAGGTETEIINTTLPGGTGTYQLQPTGGGSPNPDYYRAVATVPGYSQIIENHSFTLTGPHDVIIEMRPDSGGPTDPDRAYLEFYVRDFSANGIAGASVQCNNQIKQTNSKGYTVFEVAKNGTYPYKASKSGYVTIEGTATVADGPRYTANVVLGAGSVPTYTPTAGPGGPGSTPTAGPGGPGSTPTPDHRTNEQKGQAVIDMIADNAEGIGALAMIGLILGLLKLIAKW